MKKLLLLTIIGLLALPIQAQDNPTIAAVTDGNIWLYDLSGTGRQITSTQQPRYDALRWSADGSLLSYVEFNQDFIPGLVVTGADGANPTTVAQGFSPEFPPSFDGDSLLYVVPNTETVVDEATMMELSVNMAMDIFRVEAAAGATPEHIGTFLFGGGCGGGSSYPAEWRYADEAGFGGSTLTLQMTPYGVVHSMGCGGIRTALLNTQTGDDVELGTNFGRVKVSPDGTQALGINNFNFMPEGWVGELAIVDLATQQVTTLVTEAMPDQIAWGAPGSGDIFYSVRNVVQSDMDLTPEQAQIAAQALGYVDATNLTIPVATVQIHRYNTQTNTNTVIYTADAYAIGRMAATPDGSALLFSQVPNMNTFVRGLVDGTFSVDNPDSMTAAYEAFQTEVYRLSLVDSSISLVGTNINQMALNPA